MKLTEQQLRQVISQVITEAKTDPEDALKQFIAAAKVMVKFGPMISEYLSSTVTDYYENVEYFEDTPADLDEAGSTVEQLAEIIDELSSNVDGFLEDARDLSPALKAVKKATKKSGGAKPPRETPRSGYALRKRDKAQQVGALPKPRGRRVQPYNPRRGSRGYIEVRT